MIARGKKFLLRHNRLHNFKHSFSVLFSLIGIFRLAYFLSSIVLIVFLQRVAVFKNPFSLVRLERLQDVSKVREAIFFHVFLVHSTEGVYSPDQSLPCKLLGHKANIAVGGTDVSLVVKKFKYS